MREERDEGGNRDSAEDSAAAAAGCDGNVNDAGFCWWRLRLSWRQSWADHIILEQQLHRFDVVEMRTHQSNTATVTGNGNQ